MRCHAAVLLAGWLGMISVLVAGCGQRSENSAETTAATPSKAESSPNLSPVTPAQPATETVVAPYELDAARQVIPAAALAGTLDGTPFVPQALIEGDYLIFQTFAPDTALPEREIRLKFGQTTNPQGYENRKLTIRQDMPVGPSVPEILVRSANGSLALFQNGYALTLELNHRTNWLIPGKIYLCLPDDKKTVLAGVFTASFPRQPLEPPGPQDLPLVKGSVKLIGAPAESRIRVGYVAHPKPDVYCVGSTDIAISGNMEPLNWQRSESQDKQQITTLIAGDGKDVPSRYEHTRLPTGRYLVSATLLPNGPAAWKWVNVLPGETHTIDLTIDATQTGGLEITAPVLAVKSVLLVPADVPEALPLDMATFTSCAWQLGLEQPIISRKALFKKLAPGRYEVRANTEARLIDVVAGKTVELDYDKAPPQLPKPATSGGDEVKK